MQPAQTSCDGALRAKDVSVTPFSTAYTVLSGAGVVALGIADMPVMVSLACGVVTLPTSGAAPVVRLIV